MLNYSDRKILLDKQKVFNTNHNSHSKDDNPIKTVIPRHRSQSEPKNKIQQIEKINSNEFFKISKYHEPFSKQGKLFIFYLNCSFINLTH
jgi:hypothetical protein